MGGVKKCHGTELAHEQMSWIGNQDCRVKIVYNFIDRKILCFVNLGLQSEK